MPCTPQRSRISKYLLSIALTLLALSSWSILRRDVSPPHSHTTRDINSPTQANTQKPTYADASAAASLKQATEARVSETYGKLPLMFEANAGQTDKRVRFLSRGSGYNLFLTSTEAVLALNKPGASKEGKDERVKSRVEKKRGVSQSIDVVRMKIVGGNPTAKVTGHDELAGRTNYLIGNNPQKWHTDVPSYARVKYEKVYPGIDLVYYGNQRQLEYDFVVAPGADPRTIKLSFKGARKLELEANGDLLLQTGDGTIRQQKPLIYQEVNGGRQEVAGGYILKGQRGVGFRVGEYDRSKPLVIDPILVYSTFLDGGFGFGGISNIAVDNSGNAYVTGGTQAIDFPADNNLLLPLKGEFAEAFVTKINPTGTQIVFSTLLGGNQDPADTFNAEGRDGGGAIAVDSSGNVYVGGSTTSKDFPVTPRAYRETCQPSNGIKCSNSFVTKLNSTGTALIYSTYLGNVDQIADLEIDNSGNAYIGGLTSSPDSPIVNGFQTESPSGIGNTNAYAAKLNSTGSAILYSTFVGGTPDDIRGLVSVGTDAAGNLYLSGSGFPDYPIRGGIADGASFIAKFNPAASGDASLVYFTYVPGGFTGGMAVDASGNAYIVGDMVAPSYITPGALPLHDCDIHVAKFNTNVTGNATLVYYTPLGGSGCEYAGPFGGAIGVDAQGNAYVTAGTISEDFPLTADAFQKRHSSPLNDFNNSPGFDAFVTKLNATGTAIIYSTLFGGAIGAKIAVGSSGNAYLAGPATIFLPASPDAIQPIPSSINANFVAKIDSSSTTVTYSITGRVTDESGNGISGATVKLKGTQDTTTQTDSNGNYSFTELTPFGHYTLTATKSGFVFSPYNQTFSNLSQNQTLNFTGKAVTTSFSISGNIFPDGGVNFPPGPTTVTLSLNGTPIGSVMTSGGSIAYGTYLFTNLTAGGNYTVTPSSPSFVFNPASQTFNNLSANQERVDFAARPVFNIYNLLKDFKNLGITNVCVKLTDTSTGQITTKCQSDLKMSDLPASVSGLRDKDIADAEVECDADSIYAFTGLGPGTYIVKPESPNYTYSPPTITYTTGNTTNQGGVFSANPALTSYTIGGQITNKSGAGINDLRILMCGTRLGKTDTNASGQYSFTTMVNGDHVKVEPSRTGMTFNPTNLSFINLSGNQTANFTDSTGNATPTPTPTDASQTVQFGQASYTVSEGAGFATINVTRNGNNAVAATVNYATSDAAGLAACTVLSGNASERCDYATTLGTLRWAAGESSPRSFTIPIVDDRHNEGDESFSVTLTSATGVNLGTIINASVKITDNGNDTGASNPIDEVGLYINQLYLDFLGRLPDATGLANWTGTLQACPGGGYGTNNPTCDRIHLAKSTFQSEEFQTRGYWAYRFYETALGRRPNYAEFIPDMALVGGPKSPPEEALSKDQFMNAFTQRSEFTTKYDSTLNNPTAYVNLLVQAAGLPDHPLKATLISQLQNGQKTRAQVLRELVESKEVEDRFYVRGFVSMLYYGFLRRDPDPTGFQNYVDKLNAAWDPRAVTFDFIYSAEYLGRFGKP
jgi:hypothetical protein